MTDLVELALSVAIICIFFGSMFAGMIAYDKYKKKKFEKSKKFNVGDVVEYSFYSDEKPDVGIITETHSYRNLNHHSYTVKFPKTKYTPSHSRYIFEEDLKKVELE